MPSLLSDILTLIVIVGFIINWWNTKQRLCRLHFQLKNERFTKITFRNKLIELMHKDIDDLDAIDSVDFEGSRPEFSQV